MKEIISKYYSATEDGQVFSIRTGKPLIGKIDRYGYRVFCISTDNGVKHVPAHRIVALCNIPNPLNLPVVNHKDGNKLNNAVSNLEWCTVKYNTQHAADNGLLTAWNKGKTDIYSKELIQAMSENMPHRKAVLALKNGEVSEFISIRKLCTDLGLDRRTAQRVLDKKPNYNTINGYKLEYAS